MLKVLGICGSPRDGNSKYLLEEALEAAKSIPQFEVFTDYYSVRGKKLAPCVMCQKCADNGGVCIIKDDFNEFVEKWIEADVVLYSVPVYHMGIPAQLKAALDRLGNSLFGRYSKNFSPEAVTLPKSLKVIGAIAQGAHVFSGQEHTITDLINHALIMGCVPVTGDMWEAYIGAGGWTYNDIDRNAIKKQVAENKFDALVAVKASRALAKRAVELAGLLKAGARVQSEYLKKDPVYIPLLERLAVSE
ncbi:flavodoxin family protein [Zhaonella formicivorans]|uniref:flavodoxin family protein n=1 Tax=Zhaonella formicivorans TaxID=2528593 RepID=UPI0010E59AC3|nr:flavodoxin family protein [Zhaonella formicivorans]